jgi:glycerol uptake facilitator protein|tara:strand:+ start:308 stop:1117 length:810 start_codon:yes stop_codon:yes gene_type:complete
LRIYAAEVVGTFLLVLFGTGAVASAVLTGAHQGLWQVAVVWGFGVTLAIYATATISGAHLNPAVTLAFAIFRPHQFQRKLLPAYWAAQLVGGVLAGLVILVTFGPFIDRFENDRGLVRGEAGSEHSAMVFGEYFPNPDIFGTDSVAHDLVSPLAAMGVEALGTGILVLIIFALVDPRNGRPAGKMTALFIGFTVAVLISLFAPITQGGWNPARDFGPRIVAYFAGWEDIAIPGPRDGFWIYIVGPLIGGPIGAAIYDYVLRPASTKETE